MCHKFDRPSNLKIKKSHKFDRPSSENCHDYMSSSASWHDHMLLDLSKCNSAESDVKFIDHVVESDTRSSVLHKVLAVKTTQKPHGVKLFRRLFGIFSLVVYIFFISVNWHFRYITDLIRYSYSNKVTLIDFRGKAFVSLKEKACNFSVLYTFEFNKCFHLFVVVVYNRFKYVMTVVKSAVIQVGQSDGTYLSRVMYSSESSISHVNWSMMRVEVGRSGPGVEVKIKSTPKSIILDIDTANQNRSIIRLWLRNIELILDHQLFGQHQRTDNVTVELHPNHVPDL